MEQRGTARNSIAEDSDARFEELYQAHHRVVLAYCARRATRADAWDAASDVFVVAWRRLSDVPVSGEARPWLLGVAKRVLANQRRTTQRRRRLIQRAGNEPHSAVPHADEVLIRNETETEVIDALNRLRPLDREIIQLSLWEELPRSEIAALLRIPRATVDQRFHRAKRRLARQLGRQTGKDGDAQISSERGGAQ